jgi:hypothetical protein
VIVYEHNGDVLLKCKDSLVSVVSCQAEISATGQSLVQRSTTECVVSECDLKISTRWRAWTHNGCRAQKKKRRVLIMKLLIILPLISLPWVLCLWHVITHQLSTHISFSGSTMKMHFLSYFFLKFVHLMFFLQSHEFSNYLITVAMINVHKLIDKHNPESQKYEGTVWHVTENKFKSSIQTKNNQTTT